MKSFACLTILLSLAASGTVSADLDETVTQWNVQPAIGMDALLLIGAASGDLMQSHIYSREVAAVRENMSAEGVAALDRLDAVLRQELGRLTGPTLAYIFSAGPVATLDDVIESAANPVARLKPGLEMAQNWDASEFESALQLMPAVHTALLALRDTGFVEQYRRETLPKIEAAIAADYADVIAQDIVPEQERRGEPRGDRAPRHSGLPRTRSSAPSTIESSSSADSC